MERFDNMRSRRKFDNVNFIDFTQFMKEHKHDETPELSFATELFEEIAAQHIAM